MISAYHLNKTIHLKVGLSNVMFEEKFNKEVDSSQQYIGMKKTNVSKKVIGGNFFNE